MLTPLIQNPLTKTEVRELVRFLSYHLGYVPATVPRVKFVKSKDKFASIFQGYKVKTPDLVDEINRECGVFYDHPTNTIVIAAYTYTDGKELPVFILTIGTMLHELIHFFQYSTGTFGTYRILYEGTNDFISSFLANDFNIDYKKEVVYSFNLIMELTGHDFWEAFQWMRVWTLHSDKNKFVHRSIKQCPSFSKYNPRKLLKLLDDDHLDKIENEDTKKIFTRYSLRSIIEMCKKNRLTIQV